MSFRADKRGQIRMIEAFFASLLILSTVALIPSQFGSEQTHYTKHYSEATQALVSLDTNGLLSGLIAESNWVSLQNSIQTALPVSLWFNFTVFNEDMNILNDVTISNGGPVSEEVVAVNYVCVSSNGNYAVYLVRLQVAEAS